MKKPYRISFLILFFGAFLNWMSYGLVYPIFAASIFHHHSIFLGVSSDISRGFWLGVLLSACPIAQFFSSPFIGELSDRKGRKPVMQITTLIIAFGALFSAIGVWLNSLFLLIFGRIVTGIGAGNMAVINSSVADMSPANTKTKNFALITMANGLGFAVGPYLGGKLSVYGYETPFLFAIVATVLCFILICFFYSETLVKKILRYSSFISQFKHHWKTTVDPRFRIIFPAFFLFCFGWSFYWEFIPVTWIKSYGLDISHIGNFYAFGSFIYVLSSGILIRPIVNRFKGFPILFIALAALGLFLLLLYHASIGMYWFNIGIQQFLIALIFPVGTAIVSNLTAKNQQGETLGIFMSLQSFAFAATPFLGGSLLSLSYDSPYMIGGVSMFLSCLILIIGFIKSKTKIV